MSKQELVGYLLANRARIGSTAIVDCLALADLKTRLKPWERVQPTALCELLDVATQSYVSKRLKLLVRAGLLEYESGFRGETGYVLLRVGPA